PGEGDPSHILDGTVDTFWHSRYSEPAAKAPHFVVLDMADELNVAAMTYEARRGNPNGRIKQYELYLSQDGKSWGEPVAKGEFDEALTQTVRLAQPVRALFLKLVALSEQKGQKFATIAELNVIEADK
ncbi:MAG: discoidin domain-containing protein, partial [Methanobacterium paludis]|nr:discoidin domain-containing protein [Methanobacterium paludis]